MEEVNRYYSGPITLDEAESYIQSGLITAARVYVANGYYLRRIRDDRLFEERGYRNFEEYVRDVYNKDKGWASKCINVNQELSDGGDSPILSDRYQGYTTYQLVEIAYMTEDQREEVAPDMTVKKLREIRKPDQEPESGKVVTSQLNEVEAEPEATNLEKSSCPPNSSCRRQEWGTSPEEQSVGRGECKKCWDAWKKQKKLLQSAEAYEAESEPVAEEPDQAEEIPHFKAGEYTIDSAYGAMISLIVRAYLDNGYAGADKECEVSAMGLVCKVLRRPEVTVFYREDGRTFFDVENNRLEDEYQYWHGKEEVEQSDQLPEPEPEPVDEGCKHWEEQVLPDENWNIGDLPQAKEKYVRSLAKVFVEKMGSQLVLESFSSIPSDDVIKRKITELDRKENGVEIEEGIMASSGAELIEFFRGGEDFGVCSFARLGTQVRKALEEWQKREPDTSESEDQEVEKKAEEVIDAEFTEVKETEKEDLTDLQIAQEELERAQSLLNKCLRDVPDENNVHIRGMKLKVAALASLVCEIDDIENPPPKPEQPELPVLKNNDQRAAFVDNFETWPLWIETEQTGERYYRYDLEDGTSMVVKVYHARLFSGLKEGTCESQYREGYGHHEYYLLQPGRFFWDCGTNRSSLIEHLKEIQKKG